MKIRVRVPKMGLTVEEVTFATWEKSEGDRLQVGEVIATVEGDKAIVEVVAPTAGVLLEKIVKIGDVLPIGAEIAVVEMGAG